MKRYPTDDESSTSERIVTKTSPKPTCIYCGIREGATRDHIPPKGLFATPRPNLVTVPCCEPCQKGQSLDDEYFLRTIGMRRGIADNRSARSAQGAAIRSLTKPQKTGFTRALIASLGLASIHSPGGLYLGQAMTYNADVNRLCNVIQRTTCGLYFHKFGVRVPDDHICLVYAMDGFASADLDVAANARKMWDSAISGKRYNFGNDVFSYWVQRLEGIEFATLWAFLVYASVAFVAVTAPATDLPHPAQDRAQ
jgi:hypothetical protein